MSPPCQGLGRPPLDHVGQSPIQPGLDHFRDGASTISLGNQLLSTLRVKNFFLIPCLISLIAFFHEMTGLVNEGRSVDVIFLYFSRVVDTTSHNIFIDKLMKYGWDQKTELYWEIAEQLGSKGFWLVAQNPPGCQSLVVYPSGWYQGHYCLTSSLIIWREGQHTPTGILQKIQNWEDWSIHQIFVLPTRISWCSTMRVAKSCTWGAITPSTSTGWGPSTCKAACQKTK